MFSDSYKIKLVDDVVYEVYGTLETRVDGDIKIDGANPSAEEADEGTDVNSTTGVDIVLNHRLTETGFGDKKSFTAYLKEYMKKWVLYWLKNYSISGNIKINKTCVLKWISVGRVNHKLFNSATSSDIRHSTRSCTKFNFESMFYQYSWPIFVLSVYFAGLSLSWRRTTPTKLTYSRTTSTNTSRNCLAVSRICNFSLVKIWIVMVPLACANIVTSMANKCPYSHFSSTVYWRRNSNWLTRNKKKPSIINKSIPFDVNLSLKILFFFLLFALSFRPIM